MLADNVAVARHPQKEDIMEDLKQAANSTDEVAELANPNTDGVSDDGSKQPEDITQTQAFARRLAEATTKAEQKARDELVSEMYGEEYGIHTYSQLKEYQKDQELRQEYESKYSETSLPPEVMDEIVKSRKFREQYEEEQNRRKSEDSKRKDQLDFLEYFKELNGRDYDTTKDTIPDEVWLENNKGTPLKKAYSEYVKDEENKRLKAEIEELKKGTQAKQSNVKNAKTTTGSVTGSGSAPIITYTMEQIQNMSREEVLKNQKAVMESYKLHTQKG